ncbi:unnamed protein product [Periconia digitata]|uniref:MOSC domain-containing protein n=1 Tax=Periconia digitata TaxID=1303443 RepID=A0A9W4U9V2_9PLEO|nr:unnamed protein product [Periconia digitata]
MEEYLDGIKHWCLSVYLYISQYLHIAPPSSSTNKGKTMAFSATTQGAIVLTIFLLPILTYLYWGRSSKQAKQSNAVKYDIKKKVVDAGPLPMPTEITSIFVHPIKSCHGLTVKKAKLLPTGFDLDRQWMWVTEEDFKFLTIRNLSKMTLIRTSYDESSDTLTVTAPSSPSDSPSTSSRPQQFTIPAHPKPTYDPSTDTLTVTSPTSTSSNPSQIIIPAHPPPIYNATTDTLTITVPSQSSPSSNPPLKFTISAHPTSSELNTSTTPVSVEIWGKRTPAYAYPASLTEPFNSFFGKPVRLVYKPPFDPSAAPRRLGSNGAADVLGRDASTCFPDMMPVLIGCESSLNELNQRIRAAETSTSDPTSTEQAQFAVDIRRFRPNILVKGNEPWDEDRWETVRLVPSPTDTASSEGSAIVLDITQRCARCQVPNVDPDTAEKHTRQPWNELMKYRRVDEGIKYKPCFGMLCVPREEKMQGQVLGVVEVGMKMEVLEVTGEHRYIAGFS